MKFHDVKTLYLVSFITIVMKLKSFAIYVNMDIRSITYDYAIANV